MGYNVKQKLADPYSRFLVPPPTVRILLGTTSMKRQPEYSKTTANRLKEPDKHFMDKRTYICSLQESNNFLYIHMTTFADRKFSFLSSL